MKEIVAVKRGAEFRPESAHELFPNPPCARCGSIMAETETLIVKDRDGINYEIHAACLPPFAPLPAPVAAAPTPMAS